MERIFVALVAINNYQFSLLCDILAYVLCCKCRFSHKLTLQYFFLPQSMTAFMSPPPAATSVALHPENNDVIAIGMEDSTIQIYYFRSQRVLYLSFYCAIESRTILHFTSC